MNDIYDLSDCKVGDRVVIDTTYRGMVETKITRFWGSSKTNIEVEDVRFGVFCKKTKDTWSWETGGDVCLLQKDSGDTIDEGK